MGTYTKSSTNRAARPRSERLRESGGVIVSTSTSVMGGASYLPSGNTHTHANLDALNMITVDDGYIYLTDTYIDETTQEQVTETVKVKAGYADKAAANADGYTLDWFIPVTVNGSLTLKLNPIYAGLWAEGFGSFGGANPGGGGGGGVDLDRVWDSLTNNTDKPNVKINAAHIPIATTSAIGGVKVDGTTITIQNGVISAVAQGTGSVNSLTVGSTNYTPDGNGVITIPAYPTTLPASDVYSWAKASSKPSYSLSEISETSDLQAIEALTGTGFLKRTGTNTWAIDNSTYLTAVPKATDSVIGGFQTGYSESGKNYAVKMSGNKAYVNVPWTDTVYTHPTNGANTTISAANGKVLSSITVDTMGHVTAVAAKTLAAADIPALDYLPLTGGELTGDLWLHTRGLNYGSKLWFGDKGSGDGYVYLYEDEDDHLHIHAADGIKLSTGDGYGILLDNNVTLNSGRSLTFGNGVLKWDSTNTAWHLEGNFYVDGFLTAGGIGSTNTQLVTLAGTQTITGAKTFSSAVNVNGVTLTGSSSKLTVDKDTQFNYATNKSITISSIVSRIEALEEA